MAAAKWPPAIRYHFQKPLQGRRGEDTKWLYPIILLWHMWTVHCGCAENWNNKGLSLCLYGDTGAMERFCLHVSKICWRELCQWSYIDLERKPKNNNPKSEDMTNMAGEFIQDGSPLSQVPRSSWCAGLHWYHKITCTEAPKLKRSLGFPYRFVVLHSHEKYY